MKKEGKEKLKFKTPHEINSSNTLSISSTPYVEFIMFFLSITRLAKKFYQLCAHSLPFGNEFIKHKLRKAWDAMHEIKIRVHHRLYQQIF
jgi:hypothetical protein